VELATWKADFAISADVLTKNSSYQTAQAPVPQARVEPDPLSHVFTAI